MAGRFTTPYPQFLDASPEVRAGAKLFFYAAGTSTKLDTYSDRNLSSPNTNPVVLNSAGYPSVDIFLQDLDYKVVLAPSTDSDPPTSPIWTADYVNARDSKLIAKTVTGSGSPNGAVAGTAGSASILPDFYWDYTNQIFYVCTSTGTSSTAVWTALNASSSTASVPPPQGRLTLTSATPVLVSDVTAATTVYYTPFTGNQAPVYNGSIMVPTEFSELSLSLVSSHAASNIYDVFLFSNSGVLTLATGPAWSSATAGAGARGTGAGTTQLTRVKGFWVNAVSITGRNGSSTYTIGASSGLYLGSLFMDGTNGQVSCHVAYGQSRKWGVWNAYNQAPIVLKAGDATATWNYTLSTVRPSNNSTANSLTVFCGLPINEIVTGFDQNVLGDSQSSNSGITYWKVGVGWNSTTAMSGTVPTMGLRVDASPSAFVSKAMSSAKYMVPPSLGTNVVTALESSTQIAGGGGATITYSGTETNMLLSATWWG